MDKKTDRELYITFDEFMSFIKAAYNWRVKYGLLFDIIGHGGLRVSEALGIKVKHCDFRNNSINIKTLKTKGNPIIEVKYPKRVIEILVRYIYACELEPNAKLFDFTRQWAWQIMKRISTQVPEFTKRHSPHALRHMHDIVIAEVTHNDHITMISKHLRHKTVNLDLITCYTHMTDAMQEKIISEIEKKK